MTLKPVFVIVLAQAFSVGPDVRASSTPEARSVPTAAGSKQATEKPVSRVTDVTAYHVSALDGPFATGLVSRAPTPRTAPIDDVCHTNRGWAVSVPLNAVTLLLSAALVALAALGVLHVYLWTKRHKCSCPLCAGVYVIEDKIGSGGFGSVYVVRSSRVSTETALAQLRRGGLAIWQWLRATRGQARHPSPATAEPSAPAHGAAPSRPPAGLPPLKTSPSRQHLSAAADGGGAIPVPPLTPAVAAAAGAGTHVLKMIPVSDINDATIAQREARDLRFLRHPRIVRYVDDFLHQSPARLATQQGELFVCIVMERCGCDLRRYIQRVRRRRDRVVPEAAIVKWAAQLVSALKYCHARGLFHQVSGGDGHGRHVCVRDG